MMPKKQEFELHRILNDMLLFHAAIESNLFGNYNMRRVRFYVLGHLYKNSKLSISRLSELSFTKIASTSRMVDSMEKEGLITRHSVENDRRKIMVSLSKKGKTLYKEVNLKFNEDIINRFSSVDPNKFADILEAVMTLRDALEKHDQNLRQK